MPAQLMATNGPLATGERSWIARAASSLPVPLSPVMRTGTWVGATLRCSRTPGASPGWCRPSGRRRASDRSSGAWSPARCGRGARARLALSSISGCSPGRAMKSNRSPRRRKSERFGRGGDRPGRPGSGGGPGRPSQEIQSREQDVAANCCRRDERAGRLAGGQPAADFGERAAQHRLEIGAGERGHHGVEQGARTLAVAVQLDHNQGLTDATPPFGRLPEIGYNLWLPPRRCLGCPSCEAIPTTIKPEVLRCGLLDTAFSDCPRKGLFTPFSPVESTSS